jgi:histidinol-phosphate/aromatic aminotransferase/cobyric acid decarboxylase-like protein
VIPHPGDHGGDAVALARALGVEPAEILDLSMSLNPVADGSAAEVVRRHADAVSRYPDPAVAVAVLADGMGVDPARLLLTNGGAEAIALVAAVWPEGWVEEPDFALYRRHLGSVVPGARRWRSNPHNPSGRLAGAEETAAVWDEAFYPLATGRWTRGDADQGAVVVGSLTKLLACPGLRVGYVLAPDVDSAARLAARQPRWAVNGLACAALPELLATIDVEKTAAVVAQLRGELVGMLRGHGLRAEAADAPWVLVQDAPGLRQRLAVHGVLVRDCASFGLADTVRVAVPDEAGLARLDQALGRTVAGQG